MSCCEEENFGPVARSGLFALPEQWAQNDVVANQAAVPLSAQVSTNFDDITMVRDGSLVGLVTRFTEVITAGTATVIVTINGVATALLIVHTAISNSSGGIATAAFSAIDFVAGDLIGVTITTDAGFLPVTTDVEAWIQVGNA